MSIEHIDSQISRSFRSLMFPATLHLPQIKDLKDLRAFFWVCGYYRHAGPKGPEEMFSYANTRGGQAPALRAREGFSSPCPVRDQAIPNYSLLLIVKIV